MATSRTGTAKYLRNRKRALRQAQTQGLTHCPGHEGNGYQCGVRLDYETPLLDESAETDHIIQHRHGGTDDIKNLRVICRRCNRDRTKATVGVPDPEEFPTLAQW
jgi:5-methylcytosine-specific restriction protein A